MVTSHAPAATELTEEAAGPSISGVTEGLARLFALGLSLIYPACWLAQFSLDSLAALLRALLPGYELKALEISVAGAFVLSGPASAQPFAGRAALGAFGAETLAGFCVATALGAAVLYATRRRTIFAGGLFAAAIGFAGMEDLLMRLWFAAPGAGWVAEAAIFTALWTLGLRRAIALGTRRGAGWGWRFLSTVVGFSAPLATMLLVLHGTSDMPILRRFVWVFVPGLLPGLLASAWPAGEPPVRTRRFPRRLAAAGAALTVVMAIALGYAGPALGSDFVQARAAAARRMVESLPKVPPDAPYPRNFFQRGVNFTAEFGAPYASVDALRQLIRLHAYGVNAVALVPYGWTRLGDPNVRISHGPRVWESDEGMEYLAREAHSLGMKVFLKPQLWVRGGSPTGVEFSDPAERAEWFRSYGQFIAYYARLATRVHADLFSVGVELAGMSGYDAEWMELIGRVRRIYPGPLVYAANFGPDFRDVKFWDALDYIGLDEYYPLPDTLSTAGLVERVKRVEARYRRPVIFTEVGFASRLDPELRPWDPARGAISLDDQARCYQAIFSAFYGKPWFDGMYWWKVGTNGEGGPDDASFTPWGKPAMNVVRRWYLGGGR
jgi:hypothetical protein